MSDDRERPTARPAMPPESGRDRGRSRARLRETFNEAAELYDRIRPGYPPQLFDDLAELAGVGPGCRVLEIGCGTGQATVPLAERGCRIVAVELGGELARLARRNLAGFPAVEVVTAAFEDWPVPRTPFDLVFAATAFHWIDPRVRVAKSAAALGAGGFLATITTHHVAGGSAEFFAEVQRCYERFDPTTPPGLRLRAAADIPPDSSPGSAMSAGHPAEAANDPDGQDAAERRFEPPVFRRYERELTYSTGEYLDLLLTYSGHQALEPSARAGLLECVAGLVDRGYGGRISKRYLTELRIARLSQ